jgi:hypothetical protein
MGSQQSAVPMFQTEIAPEGGFLSWLIQQIAAPLPLVLWSVLVSPLEQAIAPWLTVSRNIFELFPDSSNRLDPQFFARDPCSTNISWNHCVRPPDLGSSGFLTGVGILLGPRTLFLRLRFRRILRSGPRRRERLGVRTDDLSDGLGHCLLAGHDLVDAPSGVESVGHAELGTGHRQRSHTFLLAIGPN